MTKQRKNQETLEKQLIEVNKYTWKQFWSYLQIGCLCRGSSVARTPLSYSGCREFESPLWPVCGGYARVAHRIECRPAKAKVARSNRAVGTGRDWGR